MQIECFSIFDPEDAEWMAMDADNSIDGSVQEQFKEQQVSTYNCGGR